MLRFRDLKLSQRAFAARYGLGYSTIRDLEQGTTKPTPAIRLIVAAIARDPHGMEQAAKLARVPCDCRPDRSRCCARDQEV
ncbi:helix-turn-helix domain-containing protein [Sphingobium sp. AM]